MSCFACFPSAFLVDFLFLLSLGEEQKTNKQKRREILPIKTQAENNYPMTN